MPNSFTPNGDDLNDEFTAVGDFIEEFHLLIYDRWGKLIFETLDQNSGWNGTFLGRAASEGVYMYRVSGKGFNGQDLKTQGSILLLR